MEIAKYFASFGIKVDKADVQKLDKYLKNLDGGIAKTAKTTKAADTAAKKEAATVIAGTKEKVKQQKELNKTLVATAKNQRAWTREFQHSIKAMTVKPATAKALREQQAAYNQLFGARQVVGGATALGRNQRAWDSRFRSQIQSIVNTPTISRRARQDELNQAFGAGGVSNPRTANMLNQRLSYLPAGKSDTLADMAAHYKNEQNIAALRKRERDADIRANQRKLDALNKEMAARLRLQATLDRREEERQRRRTEWDRRQAMRQAEWDRRRAIVEQGRVARGAVGGSTSGRTRGFNGFNGLGGRLGMYAVGAGAFMGMAGLNRKSQELQANELALVAASGSEAEGARYSQYLSDLGDRLGKKTSTMSPFFAQMLAGSKGTALEPHLETGFASLMEYSSVMGLDDQKVKGTIRAFTQMIGKQQIMAEELRGQAAEHLPPVVRLMADVAAGGDMKKLNKMMEMGQLDPNVHLPLLFERLKQEAAPFMDKYFQSSRFAQGQVGKTGEDLVKVFAKGGGEAGFTRLFKSLNSAMKEAGPTVEMLARGFDKLSSYVSFAMLLPQSFKRAFEDRDSWVADTIGEMNAKIIYDLTTGLGELASEISTTLKTAVTGWGLILTALGPAVTDFLRRLKDIFLYTFKMLNAFLPGGGGLDAAANYGRAMQASLNGATPEDVKLIAQGMSPKGQVQAPANFSTQPISATGQVVSNTVSLGAQQIVEGLKAAWDWGNLNTQSSVTVQPGAFVINTQASNGEQLMKELEPRFKDWLRVGTNNLIGEALLTVPNTGN